MEHQSQPDSARTDAPPSAYLASLIDAALEAHQAGRLDAAEPLYREALALDPTHRQALHYFGVLQHQRGDHDFAAESDERSAQTRSHRRRLLEQPRPRGRRARPSRRSDDLL